MKKRLVLEIINHSRQATYVASYGVRRRRIMCICVSVVLVLCLVGCSGDQDFIAEPQGPGTELQESDTEPQGSGAEPQESNTEPQGSAAESQDLTIERQVAMIREEIVQEYPDLLSESVSDFEKTNLLRDWAYANTIFGEDCCFNYYKPEKPTIQNFVLLTENFQNFELSAYCGGVSTYLALVYNVFGYEAVSLDCAVFSEDNAAVCSHVVTLCKILDENQGEKWIVQDATFNRTYVDADGIPLAILELLNMLKERRDEDIHYIFGNTQGRRYVSSTYPDIAVPESPTTLEPNTFMQAYYPSLSEKPEIINDRYFVFRDMRQPSAYQRSVQSILNNTLGKRGYPPKADYLYLFPVGLYSIGYVSPPAITLSQLQAFAAE